MGTYGFAQFQADVRKSDEDLKRSIEAFKKAHAVEDRASAQLKGTGTASSRSSMHADAQGDPRSESE